jgi:hypothetical protein
MHSEKFPIFLLKLPERLEYRKNLVYNIQKDISLNFRNKVQLTVKNSYRIRNRVQISDLDQKQSEKSAPDSKKNHLGSTTFLSCTGRWLQG